MNQQEYYEGLETLFQAVADMNTKFDSLLKKLDAVEKKLQKFSALEKSEKPDKKKKTLIVEEVTNGN